MNSPECPDTISPTHRRILLKLCQHSEEWVKTYVEEGRHGAYIRMMGLASEVEWLLERGRDRGLLEKFFHSLEELVEEYHPPGPEWDLLGAGLLDSMLRFAVSLKKRKLDRMERLMGPVTRRRWLDALKGCGDNISSVDRLSRILPVSPWTGYVIEIFSLGYRITASPLAGGGTIRLLCVKKCLYETPPDSVAARLVSHPHARIQTIQEVDEEAEQIWVGDPVQPGSQVRWARLGNTWYWIHLHDLMAELLGN